MFQRAIRVNAEGSDMNNNALHGHAGRRQRSSGKGCTASGSRGVALIEALVAMLIFAFGVLGLVGLQATMTKAQTGAKFRADASNLSAELLGKMWSDSAAKLGSYATANCEAYQNCADWSRKLNAQLPAAAYDIRVVVATGQVDITIRWNQAGEGQHNFQTSAMVQP
jgi:type IV pilus assembly protein PilV